MYAIIAPAGNPAPHRQNEGAPMKKFVSWNVNGFRACLQKGFDEVFQEAAADFFCLQETKMQPGQADFAPAGYHAFFHSAENYLFYSNRYIRIQLTRRLGLLIYLHKRYRYRTIGVERKFACNHFIHYDTE